MSAKLYGNDLILEGFGEVSGGEYEYVLVDGMGTLDANLACRSMLVDGIFKNKGRIETESFEAHGFLRIYSELNAVDIDLSGAVRLRGVNIDCKTFYCDGILSSDREIKMAEGIITHDGFVNIKNLRGGNISIIKNNGKIEKNRIKNPISMFLISRYFACVFDKNKAIIDEISCDDFFAENIIAGKITAKNIELRGQCLIGSVNYSGNFIAGEECKINRNNIIKR